MSEIMPSIPKARVWRVSMQPTRQQTPRETPADDGSSDRADMRTTRNAFLVRADRLLPCRTFCCGPLILGDEWSTTEVDGRRCHEDGNSNLSKATQLPPPFHDSISRVRWTLAAEAGQAGKLGKLDPAAASQPHFHPQPHHSWPH